VIRDWKAGRRGARSHEVTFTLDIEFFNFVLFFRMSTIDVTSKMLFERPTSFTTKRARYCELFKNHQTITIPDDLVISSQEYDEDDVHLEEPSEILRDGTAMANVLPEITNDTTAIEENLVPAACEEEERFEPLPLDIEMPTIDIEMEQNQENLDEEAEIQVPPPFQLDVTAENTLINEIAAANESSAKDTEDEETEVEKTDAQDKRWTKRTQQTLSLLEKAMKKKPHTPVNFKDLTKKCSRKQATHRFYTLLTLSKERCITVEQDGLFADLLIHPGARFNAYS